MITTAIKKFVTKTVRLNWRYVLRGGFWLSLGQFIASISGFLLTVGLVRLFDKAEYGTYSYLMSIAVVIAAFTISGLDLSVIKAIANKFDSTFKYAAKLKFLWSLPASFLSILGGIYYLVQDNQTLGYTLLAIAIITPFKSTLSLYGSYYKGKKQFKKLAGENILRNILTTVAVLLSAYYFSNVVIVVITFLVVSTLINGHYFFSVLREMSTPTEVSTSAIHFGAHMSFMNIFSTISQKIDRLLIFQFVGATDLAIYSVAQAPVNQLRSSTRIMQTLSLPKLSNLTMEQQKRLLPLRILILFLLYGALTLIYIFAIGPLFQIVFPDYQESILITQLFSLSLLYLPFHLCHHALVSLERKKELYIAQIVKFTSLIALLLILLPPLGMLGAVAAVLLSRLLSISVVTYSFFTLRVSPPQ